MEDRDPIPVSVELAKVAVGGRSFAGSGNLIAP